MATMPQAQRGRVATFATADLSTWRHHVSQSFVPLEVESDRPGSFRAELRARRVDRLAMFDIRVTGHSVVRTPELVAPFGRGLSTSSRYSSGGARCCYRTARRHCSARRHGALRHHAPLPLVSDGQMRHIVLMFPRDSIDLTSEDIRRAHRHAPARPTGRCARSCAPSCCFMAANFGSVHGLSAVRLAHTTIDLVTTLLASELDAKERRTGVLDADCCATDQELHRDQPRRRRD